MKKYFSWCCLFFLWFGATTTYADELMDITYAAGYTEVNEAHRPKSSLIIDGNTGDILWQDNIDEIRDPASMSKLMTLYLTFEAIEKGQITEDTLVTASAQEEAIAGIHEISNNKIVAGVSYTVSELITLTAVPSSNVTTVMLANLLSNHDPDLFLDMMNAKSQELGMTQTTWYNASGAAAIAFQGYYRPLRYDNTAANQTTARDLGILGYHFVKDYPAILEYTSQPTVTVKAGTPYEEIFDTYNYSLPGAKYGIEGVDGLKTGSSPRGAFNYMASIKRGEQRLISVIMGVGDWSDQNGEYYRHPFGNALIEKAYADYDYQKVLTAGVHSINGQEYRLNQDYYATVKKGTTLAPTVENGYLVVNNGLESISPLLVNIEKVEAVNQPKESSEVETSEQQQKSRLVVKVGEWFDVLKTHPILVFIPILGFVFLLLLIGVRQRKKKKEPKKETGTLSRRNRR